MGAGVGTANVHTVRVVIFVTSLPAFFVVRAMGQASSRIGLEAYP